MTYDCCNMLPCSCLAR